jgi:prepilin-type N-terminal cleavage/methylation domain-containing protein
MLNKIKINKNKGFTLIEVITAIFVITIGIGGAVTLINQTLGSIKTTSSKLVASYLAQEGIEIVKNIRDSNFLAGTDWTTGLTGCADGCEGDYTSQSLSPGSGNKLKIDGGFYKYSGTEETPFERKITITPDVDALEILVEVSWQERGRTYKVIAQENLYDWW